MEKREKLPGDYRLLALTAEAERRGRKRGYYMSYGELMGCTSREERDRICEAYRKGKQGKQKRKE